VNQFLPFVVVGLATGAVYGLAGIGLVLTYKTSGIFNFGYGAVAALVSFCFCFLNSRGLPWGAAAAISLLVFAPIWYPANPPTFPVFLPQSTVRLVGVNVTWAQIILIAISAAAAAALYWFFRSVRSGVVMRRGRQRRPGLHERRKPPSQQPQPSRLREPGRA